MFADRMHSSYARLASALPFLGSEGLVSPTAYVPGTFDRGFSLHCYRRRRSIIFLCRLQRPDNARHLVGERNRDEHARLRVSVICAVPRGATQPYSAKCPQIACGIMPSEWKVGRRSARWFRLPITADIEQDAVNVDQQLQRLAIGARADMPDVQLGELARSRRYRSQPSHQPEIDAFGQDIGEQSNETIGHATG